LPHTIAADAEGTIYVGDRSNRRIQVFDPDGKFQREITIDVPVPPGVQPWKGPMPSAEAATRQSGAPWAIASRLVPHKIYAVPMDIPAGFTSFPWMAKCSECSAQPGGS
jgi:hypothetical protein